MLELTSLQETQIKGFIKMVELSSTKFVASEESCENYRAFFGGIVEPTLDCSIGTVFHVPLDKKQFGYNEISISIPKGTLIGFQEARPITVNLF